MTARLLPLLPVRALTICVILSAAIACGEADDDPHADAQVEIDDGGQPDALGTEDAGPPGDALGPEACLQTPPTTADTSRGLTVLSANILFWDLGEFLQGTTDAETEMEYNDRRDRWVERLASLRPDVIALQEQWETLQGGLDTINALSSTPVSYEIRNSLAEVIELVNARNIEGVHYDFHFFAAQTLVDALPVYDEGLGFAWNTRRTCVDKAEIRCANLTDSVANSIEVDGVAAPLTYTTKKALCQAPVYHRHGEFTIQLFNTHLEAFDMAVNESQGVEVANLLNTQLGDDERGVLVGDFNDDAAKTALFESNGWTAALENTIDKVFLKGFALPGELEATSVEEFTPASTNISDHDGLWIEVLPAQ